MERNLADLINTKKKALTCIREKIDALDGLIARGGLSGAGEDKIIKRRIDLSLLSGYLFEELRSFEKMVKDSVDRKNGKKRKEK